MIMGRKDDEDAMARTAKLLLERLPREVRTAVRNDLGERGEIGKVNEAIRRAGRLEKGR